MGQTQQRTNPPKVFLASLLKDCGTIVLENGTEHAVRPITGLIYQQMQSGGAGLTELYEAAAACVPSLSHADVLALTPDMVSVIIAMATEQLERLDELLPNATRTTEPTRQPTSSDGAEGSPPTGSEAS